MRYIAIFYKKIKVSNRRFAQNDLALKLLMLETGEWDLTKKSVDKFLNDNRDFHSCSAAFEELRRNVNSIAEVFEDRDNLLSRKNTIITLYTVLADIPIEKLRPFMQYFENNRVAAQAGDNTNDEHTLLNEFTRLLQLGSDKKSSIQERSNIMKKYIQEFLNYN